MGPHYLDRFFTPRSIAVIGASDRPDSVGMRVFRNLVDAGFAGILYAVNPKHEQVQGRPSYKSMEAIGRPVDLAVIATPAKTVPELIAQCGEQGVRAVVVISAGFAESNAAGARLQQEALDNARHYGVRIIGPNCLGVMRPQSGLNATFSNNIAQPGTLALVSQSGALCTAILDWALPREVGFSAMVSLGDAADVDFGDVLDYLALDAETGAILLYVEGVRDARAFMSGLRSAARMKPVIVVKAGRHSAGSRAATSHTGAMVGADDVFDAALQRAGVVRAMTIEQLFSAAEILSGRHRLRDNRLAIVTNGGGPGVMAADRAVELDVALADLGSATVQRLNDLLPAHWSHGNPVDILGDAPPERYGAAVAACLEDDGVDGVLVMLTPQTMTRPTEAAAKVVEVQRTSHKPILTCWMGQSQVEEARRLFTEHHVPTLGTPEAAVEAFSYLANYRRNQQLLMQVPGPLAPYRSEPDIEGARLIMEEALGEGRNTLTTLESKAVLHAFGIPVQQAMEAHTAAEALVAAESLGFPLAMKISSPDITHKSDVGGVRLNVGNAQAVRHTFTELVDEAHRQRPQAQIRGVTLERMSDRPHGRELLVGVLRDPVFGPLISFGAGGTAVEVTHDRAVALPPLNRFIARRLIAGTRISRLLGEFRNLPAVDQRALEDLLVRVSEMVCELPHIREMDINPLIVDEHGAVAVDARLVVEFPPPALDRYGHMAIHPYPAHLVSHLQLADGSDLTIRPIRPEDAEIEQRFVRDLSSESRYFRFMQSLQELTQPMLVRLTQIDYDRELAMIAVTSQQGQEVEIGVARYAINPDGKSCEFALVVADAWHHKGIGSRLMHSLMDAARAKGLTVMEGEVLANNSEMLALARKLGFSVHTSPDDANVKAVRREL
ncbi:MAG: bifunctional acetate--CoA ligase family protein/GNAT family N-acetyltransferase [Gammaproteobacteria bacterium]